MRSRSRECAAAIAIAMVAGCATPSTVGSGVGQKSPGPHQATASPPAAAPSTTPRLKIDIIIDPNLDEQTSPAWLGYAMSIARLRKDALQHGSPPDLFAEEVAGRTGLVLVYRESAKAADPYLETIAAVAQAGFLKEYVLAYLVKPGWTVSATDAAALNVIGFETWARDHLKDHKPSTRAAVRTEPDPTGIPAPGKDLMQGVQLRAAAECSGLMPELARRARQWDGMTPSLGGRAVLSVRRREDALHALRDPETRARANAHGIVLVSPNVAELLRTAGFCAIETHDSAAAERFIKEVITVDPTDERAAGELAHVFILEKRWDAAHAQIDHALAVTADRCNQAILWRKKGYVFTEQRALTDARKAYLRSLELDPGNDLAVRELRLLGHLAGNSGENEPPAPIPPPTTVTTAGCPAQ